MDRLAGGEIGGARASSSLSRSFAIHTPRIGSAASGTTEVLHCSFDPTAGDRVCSCCWLCRWPRGPVDLVQAPPGKRSCRIPGRWRELHPSNPNQPQALITSPIPKEARLATTIVKKSRHIEAFPTSSFVPNANQNSRHSATGAKVSATTK